MTRRCQSIGTSCVPSSSGCRPRARAGHALCRRGRRGVLFAEETASGPKAAEESQEPPSLGEASARWGEHLTHGPLQLHDHVVAELHERLGYESFTEPGGGGSSRRPQERPRGRRCRVGTRRRLRLLALCVER